MILAVFSDSHGNSQNMIDAVALEKPDFVIFLGDGVRDAEALSRAYPSLPVRILRGNCDLGAFTCDDSALAEYCGVRVFAAHGHNHNVKFGMDSFATSVLCSGAQLGLYGHTHRPLWQECRGVQFMNPGSIGNSVSPTYSIVSFQNGSFACSIMDLPRK